MIDGKEYLFYKAFPINVALIRGTTSDPDGNITMEREALTVDTLSLAMAAHNCGWSGHRAGRAHRRYRHAQSTQVKIPGALVDCIVVATAPEHHMQTYRYPLQSRFRRRVARTAYLPGADAAG